MVAIWGTEVFQVPSFIHMILLFLLVKVPVYLDQYMATGAKTCRFLS